MTEPAKRLKANKVIEGQKCGWCARPINFGDDTAICTACDTPHHGLCWDERQGCSLATCEHAPLKQLEEPRPAPAGPAPLGGAPREQAAARRAQARTRQYPDLRPGMMHCPHCGRPIREDAEICRYCKRAPTPDGIYHGPKVNAPGAQAALVYGIVGVLCCFIFGIVAIVKANEAKKLIAEDPRYGGGGMATAGLVLGIVSLVLFAIGLLANLAGLASGPDF